MTVKSNDPKDEEQRSSSQPAPEAPALVQQETVVTHGPTQDTMEQRATGGSAAAAVTETSAPVSMATRRTVVRDMVGDRRRTVSQATQIIWFVVGLFEALLGIRLALMLSGANPEAGFTQMILGFTKPLVR